MRILFTFAGGSGHLDPLVPVARVAVAAGHTVAFTGRPAMVATVEAMGFIAFASGVDVGSTPEMQALGERYRALPTIAEREELLLREGWAGLGARYRATDLLVLCTAWQPDLVVSEELEFGGMVVAERLGLPYATVLIIAAGSLVRREVVAQPLNALRAAHGLPPDPDLAMLGRYLVLSPFPPSYRDPSFPLPATAHPLRPLTRDGAEHATLPPWMEELADVPTIYLTLGTSFNVRSRDLFAPVIAGLRDLPINLVVTVGRTLDPAEFGHQPSHVHIERYIPQSLLLPHCDLVVLHGGSGSVMGALAHGLPLVVIPLGADMPLNAARCAMLGVGRVVDVGDVTPETARAAVEAVLTDPTYRRNAERIRDEIAALPGPEQAVRLLERLVGEGRPILAA